MRPISERDSVAHIFTRDFGMMAGVLRGAVVARRNKPLVGQFGNVAWNARLDSQLGAFHWDATRNLAAVLMSNPMTLGYMNAAFDLINALLPERENYATLYDSTLDLMSQLSGDDAASAYLAWEVSLLGELGYALDLSHCSGCGVGTDLEYLSPRTGRAVCCACAAPYIDRIYRLPLTLDVTGAFLSRVCESVGVAMPASRRYLSHSAK